MWDVLDLALAVLFAAEFFYYYYVVGVHFQDRAMSRSAALAFRTLAPSATEGT